MIGDHAGRPWIVSIHGGRWLVCLSCESSAGVPYPIELERWLSVANEFSDKHSTCPGRPENWRADLNSMVERMDGRS